MDRRDALKKLGMGGATVVGASMVMSSPAFAADGTPGCVAGAGTPGFTVTQGANAAQQTTTTITVSAGTIACPCQTPAGTAPTVTATGWNLATGILDPSTTTSTSQGWTGVGNGSWAYTVTVKLTCLDSGGKPVCSSAALSGTIKLAGNSPPEIAPTAGSFAPVTC